MWNAKWKQKVWKGMVKKKQTKQLQVLHYIILKWVGPFLLILLKTFPRHCNTQNTGCQNIRLYYILGYVITVQQPRITVVDNNFQFLCTSSCTASLANLVVCWEPSSVTGDIKNLPLSHPKEYSSHKNSVYIYISTYKHTCTYNCILL